MKSLSAFKRNECDRIVRHFVGKQVIFTESIECSYLNLNVFGNALRAFNRKNCGSIDYGRIIRDFIGKQLVTIVFT